MTLHTALYLTALKPTQSKARKLLKLMDAMLVHGTGYDGDIELANALAKDAGVPVQTNIAPDGTRFHHVYNKLKGKEFKNLRDDMKAYVNSEEYKALPVFQTAQPKPAPADVLDTMSKLRAMTVDDFGKFCEAAGIKATIDRGVWSVTIPGVRGARYFDAQTGHELAAGESGGDRKLTLDMRRDEGKLTYLCALVNNNRKLTAAQKDFVNICFEGGLTIPAPLKKLLPNGGALPEAATV